MKQLLMVILFCASLIFACHSNKKGGHSAHHKKGKHSSVASAGGGGGSSNKGASASNSDTALSKLKKTRYGEGRPRINSGGVSGIGSGGSYASNSYRRDILNRDQASLNRKDYFKKRMEENDRMYYGEEVKEDIPIIEQDTTMLDSDFSKIQGDSIIQSDVDGFKGDTLSLNK